MNLSDIISQAIKEMLDKYGGTADIQRNELAGRIGCVPSQINYVISSRFTQEQGYIVESRRGGGGFIRISRASLNPRGIIMHLVGSIGGSLDENSCRAILQNLMADEVLSENASRLMWSAVTATALKDVPAELRDKARASILKNMLLTTL